jgi:hypothetical protein
VTTPVQILENALDRISVCSNDPIRPDHDPASKNDDRTLHGGACHGCLLVAETSCEKRNEFLDRALLVETMGQARFAFSSETASTRLIKPTPQKSEESEAA